ncbi:MAG: hypothetical protein ACLGH8_07575 [Bacteroidia bacterium]
MAGIIKKETIYQILFFISVGLPYLNNYELNFALWSLMALLTIRKKYSLTILHYVGYFVGIFAIAMVSSLFYHVKFYEYARDIAYMLKPIIGLVLGYQLCREHLERPMNILVNSGILLAIAHTGILVFSVVFLHIRNLEDLRLYGGFFSDFEVYALIFLLFHDKFGVQVSKTKYWFGVLLLFFSIGMYFARTNFIQLVFLFMAMKGYFVLNARSLRVIVTSVVIISLGYTAIYIYNPARKGSTFESFLYKVKNTPIEPFKAKVDINNWKDFNDNYRSYETILTIRQTKDKGALAWIIGQGMGSSVDLKQKVWLQSTYMRYIPFLHNGFMTVLLKAGILGDILLILSIVFLFRKVKTDDADVTAINNLLVGTGVFLIISYYVFMGLYFVPDPKSVLIGFLLRHRELLWLKSQNKLPKTKTNP